jgi:cullin 1
MSAGSGGRVIQWEEGWENIKKNGIGKVQSMIEKDGHGEFKPQEYVVLYTIIYKMCTQKAPFSYSKELYDGFNHSFEKYLSSVSLPAIKEKNGADKIKEMVRRWKNHKLMKKWMVSFFTYLNRYFVKRHNLEPLDRVATARFCELIYNEVKGKATEILLELITKDRNGEEVDRGLLKECIQIYVEMGLDANNGYVNDFQKPFLASTALYYSREATEWLAHDSCPEYLRKAEARFAEEAQRQRDFLHSSSESGLNKVLFQTMLADHQTELLNKENTGLKALLARHSKDDLGRLYKLYHTEPSSLEPIADIFKTHVTEAGMLLIKKATESKDTKMFVVEIIKLHQLYYDLVTDSFQGHAVFHRVSKGSRAGRPGGSCSGF